MSGIILNALDNQTIQITIIVDFFIIPICMPIFKSPALLGVPENFDRSVRPMHLLKSILFL